VEAREVEDQEAEDQGVEDQGAEDLEGVLKEPPEEQAEEERQG
jgi:hypothetical protein